MRAIGRATPYAASRAALAPRRLASTGAVPKGSTPPRMVQHPSSVVEFGTKGRKQARQK